MRAEPDALPLGVLAAIALALTPIAALSLPLPAIPPIGQVVLTLVPAESNAHQRVVTVGNGPLPHVMRHREAVGRVEVSGAGGGVGVGRVEEYAGHTLFEGRRWPAHAAPVAAAHAHPPQPVGQFSHDGAQMLAPVSAGAEFFELPVDAPAAPPGGRASG